MLDIVEEFWNEGEVSAALNAASTAQADVIDQFEGEFANKVGAIEGLFLPSGRRSIYEALGLLGVGEGDEVIIPAFLCRVVAGEILRRGATPVLVDVSLPNGEIDFDSVSAALSKQTRAIIVAHLFGVPGDFRRLKAECASVGIAIIEDCAHCLLGRVESSPVGAQGDFSIFSFNYDKPISFGGGGMLLCCDRSKLAEFQRFKQEYRSSHSVEAASEAEQLSQFIQERRQWRQTLAPKQNLSNGRGAYRYRLREILRRYPRLLLAYQHLRHNGHLDEESLPEVVGEVRAALGLSLMQQYPKVLGQRNWNAQHLSECLSDLGFGVPPSVAPGIEPAYLRLNMFVRNLPAWRLERLAEKLLRAGYRCGRLNWPVSLDRDPALFKVTNSTQRRTRLANAHLMAAHSFNLPVHQNMTVQHLEHLSAMIAEEMGSKRNAAARGPTGAFR